MSPEEGTGGPTEDFDGKSAAPASQHGVDVKTSGLRVRPPRVLQFTLTRQIVLGGLPVASAESEMSSHRVASRQSRSRLPPRGHGAERRRMAGGPGVQGDLAKPVLVPATGRRRRSCQHRLVPAALSPGPPMSSPVSSRFVISALDESLERSVSVGVVRGVVLPAVPDDVEPGAGEDSHGVWVVVSTGDGAVVEVGGPDVSASRVAREVGDGVAQLFVAGSAKADGSDLSGLPGGGCDSGQAGQRFWSGEAGAAVADFGEESCGADAAGPGQAGEDMRVSVQGQLFVDLDRQGFDLLAQAGQHGQKCSGDMGFGGAVFADGAAWGGGETGVQYGWVGSAAVADAGQPCGEPFGREPVGAFLAIEAVQKRQADLAVDVGEQTYGAREHTAQVFTQLVSQAHAVVDQVLAGAASAAQRVRGGAVRCERPQPGAIGTQRVSEHECVEAIVLIAGRTVSAAQILDLIGTDHHDRQAASKQGIDHRSIGAFDGDLGDTVFGEQCEQPAQACVAVLDGLTQDLLTAGVNNRDRVIIASPVDSSGQSVGRFVGQGNWGTLQDSLLAAEPSGKPTRTSVPERGSRIAH